LKHFFDDLKPYLIPILFFAVVGLARALSTALDVVEALYLTRSTIPLGDLFLFPYSPAYLFVLHLWHGIGESALWLRLLGLLLGLVGLVLCPRVLRGLGGAHATPGAMWLLAASPFLVDQLGSVTPAGLAFLAVIVAFWCFLEFLRAGDLGWLTGWTLTMLIALLVHGGLYYLPVVLSLGMIYYRHRYHGRQRIWWGAQVLPLALFALLSGSQFSRFIADRMSHMNTVRAAGTQWADLGTDLPMPWSVVGGVLILLLLLSGLRACTDFRHDPRHGLLILCVGIPCLIWLVWLPHDFYAVTALPGLATLASMGMRLHPRWLRQLLWLAVAITYGWSHWHAIF